MIGLRKVAVDKPAFKRACSRLIANSGERDHPISRVSPIC